MVAEYAMQRFGLHDVADGRRGSVGVDVSDGRGIELRLGECVADRADLTVRVRLGDVHRVRGVSIADNLAVDARTATFSAIGVFQDECRGSLSEHEPGAIGS